MITTKILSGQQIEDACALLYEVYIEHNQWQFAQDNPSHLKVEIKNNRKILIDRFTHNALWFGGFDNGILVGCVRLCGVDTYGKFEVESYPDSCIIHKYLTEKQACVEIGKLAVKVGYQGRKVVNRLLLMVFKYCSTQKFSVITCTHNGFLKSLYNRIGYAPTMEHAFKYEAHDPLPVNFYYVNYESGKINTIINQLKLSLQNKSSTNKHDIFDALELVAPILPTPVYWHDVNGVVLGINEHCLKAIGATREIVGKTPYEFYPEKVAAHILNHNKQIIRTGEIMAQEECIEDITTGEFKCFSAIKAPLYDYEGNIIGIIGTSVDITAEKEAARLQLENEAYKAEQRAQDRFKTFIDNIFHCVNSYKISILYDSIGKKEHKKPIKPIRITKRERDVLYYLSMNKCPKDIAKILTIIENKTIAQSTIQSIISKQLYPKFEVYSVSELVDIANIYQLIQFIPDN